MASQAFTFLYGGLTLPYTCSKIGLLSQSWLMVFGRISGFSILSYDQRKLTHLPKPFGFKGVAIIFGLQIDKMLSPKSLDGSLPTPYTPSFQSDFSVSPLSSPLSTPPGSPVPSVQTPPTSPLQPEDFDFNSRTVDDEPRSIPSPQSADNVCHEIKQRRHSFFAAIKDLVFPLLGEDSNLEYFENLVLDKVAKIAPCETVKHPAGVRAVLKPHQRDGLNFLVYLRQSGIGGILADDMGLGKTIQTLALFQHVKEQSCLDSKESAPFLVVCPLSVMKTWLSEVAKWTPELAVIKFHGTAEERERIKALVRRERNLRKGKAAVADIVITSYETLISDVAWFQRAFLWQYVVLDEGHRIKNGHSKRAQVLGRLRSQYKLVLTGTPIQNNLKELWSILNWLYPDVFDSSTEANFDDAFSLNEGRVDRTFLEHIRRFLAVIMLRRDKASPGINLNIPPKRETIISVPLSPLQHSWYLRILTGAEALLEGTDKLAFQRKICEFKHNKTLGFSNTGAGDVTSEVSSAQVPAATKKPKIRILENILMELRKCSIHPYLLDDAIPDDCTLGKHIVDSSGKFVVLWKFLHHFVLTKRTKVVIFSGFEQSLNLCEDVLSLLSTGHNLKHVRLDGKTTSAMRNLSMYLFQNDIRYKVFLVSIRAGGEGLNIISSSTVLFLDEDWNPQVMKQAESRVHRIGQTQPVEIFRIQAKGTVEEQMARRLVKKAYLAATITENTDLEPYSPVETIGFGDEFERETGATALRETLSDLFGDLVPRSVDPSDPNDLSKCDWEKVIELCTVNPHYSPTSISVEEEKAWMERSARVRTNIFNGEAIDTSGRRFSAHKDTVPLNLCRAARRIGKERTVMIDGYAVSKASIADLNTPLSPSGKSSSSEEQAAGSLGAKMSHEVSCFSCRGSNPIDCAICPRAFHEEYLEELDLLKWTISKIVCPHHYSWECGKKAAQASGLLYSCSSCVKAYCEDCLNWAHTKFLERNSVYESLGHFPNNAFYIECVTCTVGKLKRCWPREDSAMAKRSRLSL